MKLYGHPRSPCTRKVLLAAAEKGRAIELVEVDALAGEHTRAEHLARHPFAKLPALEDDDLRLYETSAILRYLDSKWFGLELTPRSLRECARMEQWLSVERAYLAPALRSIMYQREVQPQFGAPQDLAELASALNDVRHVLAVLERALVSRGNSAYLAGASFSLADVCFTPALYYLEEEAEQSSLLAGFPRLRTWWLHVSGRPAFQRVFSGRGAGRPPRRSQGCECVAL